MNNGTQFVVLVGKAEDVIYVLYTDSIINNVNRVPAFDNMNIMYTRKLH